MNKVLEVAWREFLVTVTSKAFILGLLLLPVMGTIFALVMPRLLDASGFEARGEIAVVDADGRVSEALLAALGPEASAARRQAAADRILAQMPDAARPFVEGGVVEAAGPRVELSVDRRPLGADLEREKARLYELPEDSRPFAVVVVHPNAIEPSNGTGDYGTYDLYVPPRLDDRIAGEIRRNLRDAIVVARIRAQGYDPDSIRALITVPVDRAISVSRGEEREAANRVAMLLPAAFGLLLMMGVMGGGQALLTSMVEEKSNRVIEVLLSAVSPSQLMAGKLLGHMAVSVVALGLYVALGLAVLAGFALIGLLDLSLIIYLVIFFVITYLVIGSLMMAVGSAVNDMREAQTLMTPIMLLLIVPWLLWMPISRDPDSTLAVVLSFVPPINSFAMLLRMASVSPPPVWQVWLSIGVGVAAVLPAIWFTAKVFRIGLLMHGKPPNLMTLIRWARQA